MSSGEWCETKTKSVVHDALFLLNKRVQKKKKETKIDSVIWLFGNGGGHQRVFNDIHANDIIRTGHTDNNACNDNALYMGLQSMRSPILVRIWTLSAQEPNAP
jgi:hypothetical protein